VDTSRLPELVDGTAAIAAAYVPGIKSVAGVGSGKVTIPDGGVMAGQLVPAYLGRPSESYQHVSNLPAGDVQYRSGTVTEILWDFPFRLFFDLKDEAEFRRRSIDLYFGYIAAFSQHLSILGAIASGAIEKVRFTTGADANWGWIEGHIPLVERLNLENKL